MAERDGMYPVLPNATVYPDMADNLTKVKFWVKVMESYSPLTHYVFLRDNAPPPIRNITDENMNDICLAHYPLTYIIDALIGGHYLEFVFEEDMDTAKNWIKLYLDQYEKVDLTNYPDRIAFNKNASRALAMLNTNLKQRDEYEANDKPQKLQIEDLLSLL